MGLGRIGLIIGGLALVGAAGGGYMIYAEPAKSAPVPAPAAPRAQPTQPVVVATVEQSNVPVDIIAIGLVQPAESVAIKSRIDGQITKVHFREGDEVKPGDLLFTLDSRQIEAQLRQAEAQLSRDRAQLANARREVERLSGLASKDYVTRQKFDEVRTTATVFESNVKANEAVVENLKVQITYTAIRAPIGGRLGVLNLNMGNVVKAQDVTAMVTINQIRPISVKFAVPQRHFADVRGALTGERPVAVTADIPGGSGKVNGKMNFIDNSIDVGTGTFQVKATFDNPTEALWPGMYVNVVIRLGDEPNALSIPTAAVQTGQRGTYVFAIKPDQTAEVRPITLSREFGERTVVQSGLKAGESVVIDGQLRLTNGTKVEPRQPPRGQVASQPAGAK